MDVNNEWQFTIGALGRVILLHFARAPATVGGQSRVPGSREVEEITAGAVVHALTLPGVWASLTNDAGNNNKNDISKDIQ